MTKEHKPKLAALVATAQEAEADPDRHVMEEAVLATVARHGLDAPSLWDGFDRLTWSRKDFEAVADAIFYCVAVESVAADLVIIKRRLKDKGAVVTDAVLEGILNGSKVKDASVAVRYIGIMEKQDRFRRADEAGRDYLAAVADAKTAGGDVDAAVAGLLKTAFDLTQNKKLVQERPNEAQDALGFLDTLAARRIDGRAWLGLDSGFRHLNEVLNGLTEGVFILAGAPSTGKTSLAKQIADAVAVTEKVPVLFWSFEQSKEELRIKSLARLSQVNSREIWKGRADQEDWQKVQEAADNYLRGSGRWLTIIEASREDTLDRIRAAAVMAKHKAGDKKPIMLVLDYLQIIPAGPDAPDTLRERIDYHLSELRRLSRDLKSPILVISSENREAYKGNNRPTLAAMKESGGIEYSADAVLCLWRNNKDTASLTEKYQRKTVRVEAHVLKNRNGELARIMLDFTPAWASFEETAKEDLDWSAALDGAEDEKKAKQPKQKNKPDWVRDND